MSCKNYKSLHIYFFENYNVGKPQKNFAFILMAFCAASLYKTLHIYFL